MEPNGPLRRLPAMTSADFDAFYLEHRDQIGRALAFTVGDVTLGFEAADEAMARAYARWPAVAGYANPTGWVYRTGFNWATSFLRRRTRAARHNRFPIGEDVAPVAPDVDLAAALARLPAHHRAVVVLRYFCDWSVADTAEALGVPPGTVKSRLARALDQLRIELGEPDRSGPPPLDNSATDDAAPVYSVPFSTESSTGRRAEP